MSSANLIKVNVVVFDIISLVQIEKSMGDKTHPWGAPVFKINSFDLTLFTQTVCGRSRKNALTQRTMLGLTSRSKRENYAMFITQTRHRLHQPCIISSEVQKL